MLRDLALVLAPGVLNYAVQAMCPVGKTSGALVPFRPPPLVFGVVWPVLYLLLGYAWLQSSRTSADTRLSTGLYASTSLSLAAWIYVYGCRKAVVEASWVVLVALCCSIGCFGQGPALSKLCLSPLIGWLIFALVMNTTQASNIQRDREPCQSCVNRL